LSEASKTSQHGGRLLLFSGLLLAVAGVAIRINNAFRYPPRWGFDAMFNERYVERLLESFALPAPDTDWSTAHPPLFYYLSAGLGRLAGVRDSLDVITPTRLLGSLAGLAMAWLAFRLVRRQHPDEPVRALLAAGLLLFLPVHIYMSAMFNEEILAAGLTSVAIVGVCIELSRQSPGTSSWARDIGIGLAAGLALLAKLTGLVVIAAAVLAYLWAGFRESKLTAAARRAAVLAIVAGMVGGWFYIRNLALYGYIYPQDLSTHAVMFSMPPGERHLTDYLRVPLATFTEPQVLHPDLIRSIWGTTYLSGWFEGHGHFLPKQDARVKWMGRVMLILALLPTAAFGVGIGRALRRAWSHPRGPDAALLLLTVLTLLGYIGFTWSNPMFATVKAGYLLGIGVPFAYFASDALASWSSRGGIFAACVWIVLSALLLAVCVTFSYGIGLWDLTPPGVTPGLQWSPLPGAAEAG
jgi:hypothetical protein